MRRGNSRRIVLAMRWDGASWERVPSWMGAILPLVKDIPVQWSFPAPPADFRTWAPEAFVAPIRERMLTPGDGLLPLGFSGAPHPLLTMDELEKELSWTLKNPWATGIAEVFGAKPSFLAPGMADLSRPAAAEAYRSAGIEWIGLEEGFGPPRALDGITLAPFQTATYSQPPSTSAGRELRREIDRGRCPLLAVSLPSFPTAAALTAWMADLLALLGAQGIGAAGMEALRNGSPLQAMDGVPSGCWDAAQTIRKKLEASSAYQKKKRKKNDDYRELLGLLAAPAVPGQTGAAGDGRVAGKILVAHMQGDVALTGKHFDVRLRGGRFCGMERQGRRVTPDMPAASGITILGKTTAFRSKSSVSFEHDDGAGLRDELSAEIECDRGRRETARLSVEYEFREGTPELFISAELRYPKCDGTVIEATSPLVMAISELAGDEPASIAVTCPDGSSSRHLIRERNGWRPIPGMRWAMEADGLTVAISASPASEKRWGLCLFRVARRKGRRILEANPFGSSVAVAGASVSGILEKHTILIGLADAAGKDS